MKMRLSNFKTFRLLTIALLLFAIAPRLHAAEKQSDKTSLKAKLQHCMIHSFTLKPSRLDDAIRQLNAIAKAHHFGIVFRRLTLKECRIEHRKIHMRKDFKGENPKTVPLTLHDIPLYDIAEYVRTICDYSLEPSKQMIVFVPSSTKPFPTEKLNIGKSAFVRSTFKIKAGDEKPVDAQPALAKLDVPIYQDSKAIYDPKTGILTMTNSRDAIDLVKAGFVARL